MTVGERIKLLRTSSNMTQEELGEKLGVKKAAIQKYESGSIINLKMDTIELLSQIFDVSPSYIMGWDKFDEIYDTKKLKEEVQMIEVIEKHYGKIGIEIYRVLTNLNMKGLKKILFYAEDIRTNSKYQKSR